MENELNESAETAMSHLGVIALAAEGQYTLRKGELARRQAAVMAFIRTGQCVALPEDQESVRAVKQALLAMTASAPADIALTTAA